ncbi:hypothetical protein F4692_002367 [Nocardioides cavernae]|uniref:Uncharacterized protein n=1 Tax=Nocardioides cavernae TaxID=1921566 RepID=A0A7Y9H3D6_9ACTN|nr:hypothetical protein [Nocardioides cavernae]NYE37234.1 hypothetical protein [Nocardioides cavernae]
MIPRGTGRRWLASCAGVIALTVTTGCQSSASDETGGDGPATATSSPSATSSAPVPVPDAPVEASDGKVVKVPGASMRALKTYKRVSDYGIVQGYNDEQSALTLSPNLTQKTSLDAYAKEWIRAHGGPKRMERQEDAVVGGKYNAWHVIDTRGPTEESHYFGVMFLDSAWLINIAIYKGDPWSLTPEEGEEVIASLLASFKTDLD